MPERRGIKQAATSQQAEHGLLFPTRSLAKPVDRLAAEEVVGDISHEGLRTR
ncbi:hypothetical protein [Kitasatospora sp. NPDC005748]|uniref:hypothetical protein n=1 Tax=Kitasatospora sp. NPDC005748 TaxID=3157063 RepID=UPI00340F6A42